MGKILSVVLISKDGTKLGEASFPSKIGNKLSNPNLISVSDHSIVSFQWVMTLVRSL